jgi:hypothetical protein
MIQNSDSVTLHKGSIRKVLSAAQSRMLAVFIIGAIVVNNLVPRAFMTLLDNEDISRIIASQSVLTDFFYHSTLPIKIMNKVMQGMTGMSGQKDGTNPTNDPAPRPNTSADSATLAPAAGSFTRDIGDLSSSGFAHFAALGMFCYFDVLLKNCPCTDALIFLTLMMLFFFLLPRSSVGEDAILMSVIRVVIPGLRNLKPGIFFNRNSNQTAPGRQQ